MRPPFVETRQKLIDGVLVNWSHPARFYVQWVERVPEDATKFEEAYRNWKVFNILPELLDTSLPALVWDKFNSSMDAYDVLHPSHKASPQDDEYLKVMRSILDEVLEDCK